MEAWVVRAEQLWQQPEWYQALTLSERAELEPVGPGLSAAADAHVARARSRLRAWKAEKGFADGPMFAQRLAMGSLQEGALLELLAEPAASLKARSPGVPQWLAALQDAFAQGDAAAELAPLLERVAADHPLAGCLPALGPIFQRGLSCVQRGVQALERQGTFLPFDAGMLPDVFVTNVAPAVLFQISKPLVLELHIMRLRGLLEGETSEARFANFVRQLNDDHAIWPLLARYPVLGRQLVGTIDRWADYLCEFLTHLCADWGALRQSFAADLGPLVDVESGKGDTHRRGRSVLLLCFGCGTKLLYKPKPLAADVHFQELLGWLNGRGAVPPLRPMKLLDRGPYGWSEFVAASPCESQEEVRRFYQRQGGYLAVLYALDATDLHNENLIAAGEHPVLVDLEALFHPHVHGQDPVLSELAATGALDDSVWQVGLLPRRVWSDEHSVGVDMSGLGGHAGQRNPHRLVSWDKPGTDEMRLVRRSAELPVSENRPHLGDEDVEILDYTDDLITGFTGMYRLLCRHKDALLEEQLPRFADDEIRVVVRSTNVYGLLLYESFHPDLLRDALDRDRFFDRLWMEAAQYPYLARVIPAERRDLLRGDVPMFTTTPDSRAIFTSEKEPVPDFLAASSMEGVRRRVRQLGEDDLSRQCWVIEASLATLHMTSEDRIPRPAPTADQRPVERDRLMTLAASMGTRLDELAYQGADGASWLGVGPLDESTWGLFPAGPDLYAGNGGMALFLGYLGALTGEPSHTLLANRALVSVRRQVQAWLEASEEPSGAPPPAIGAFEGLASFVYVLTSLGALWQKPDLVGEAEDLVERLAPYIDQDERLDVVYGSAGCVLSVLALHAVHPSSRTLKVAIRCGDRLLATAQRMPHGTAWTTIEDQPPLGGFSHGTAGIALSLLKLAACSGEVRFRSAALSALEYDRSLFVPSLSNWADLRVFPSQRSETDQDGKSAPGSMVAWCHGAAGIGLARLAALDQLDDERARQDIGSALRATTEYGFEMNHSLCHGALGNIELLLTAARLLGRPEHHQAVDRATAQLAASIEANGPVSGVPRSVETPGFMTGLAGIGYGLLRLAEPDRVPAVLVLAPPRWKA